MRQKSHAPLILFIPNSHQGLHEIKNVDNPVSFWFVVAQCRCVLLFFSFGKNLLDNVHTN